MATSASNEDLCRKVADFFAAHKEKLGLTTADTDRLWDHLVAIGVTCMSDMYDITKDDIPKSVIGIKKRKEMMKVIQQEITPRKGRFGSFKCSTLKEFLESCEISDQSAVEICDFLEDELEISEVEDLDNLETVKDISDDLHLTAVEKNRFLRYIDEQLRGKPMNVPPDIPVEPPPVTVSEVKVQSVLSENLITVRYVHFNNTNGESGVIKKVEGLNAKSQSMTDLKLKIIDIERPDTRACTLELYSAEGYPLNINKFTGGRSLEEWQVKNGDLFLVFTRKKNQPGLTPTESLPAVVHDQGCDEIEVVTQLYGKVKIKLAVAVDSPEDICRKVFSAIGLPTTHMSLYSQSIESDSGRRSYKEVDLHTHLSHGDVLTMVMKSPTEESRALDTEYGKHTYNMLFPQTDRGISAFFSILRFLCMKQKSVVDFSKLLRLLLSESCCPPLVHALNVLYENSFCSLSGWVAIIEGLFVMFKQWLSFTKPGEIKDDQIFEFSDYCWAALVKKVQHYQGNGMETIRTSLLCPISQMKILTPVVLNEFPDVIFDEQSVMDNLGKKPLEDMESPLKEEDMKGPEFSKKALRVLMSNPWRSDREVILWKTSLSYDHPSKVEYNLPCKWNELASCLDVLEISVPDRLLGMGSLTYIEHGYLVLYMGFTKDNESQHTIYNPLVQELMKKEKKKFKEIAGESQDKNVVSRDLTNFVPASSFEDLTPREIEGAKPKPLSKDEGYNWVAKVIVDTSGSMRSAVYEGLNRLEAAKQLFGAFSLRTQAYDMSNAVGVISFNSFQNIKIEQRLDRMTEGFEKVLEKLTIAGATALHSTMKLAADELVKYDHENRELPRRILCLTDGQEGGSEHEYVDPVVITNYLLERKIIVDTILIDKRSVNTQQKAISHATGGACFLPKSMVEGLKLFEMETLLSFIVRRKSSTTQQFLTKAIYDTYKDLNKYPFDRHLESSLFQARLPKTHSVNRPITNESQLLHQPRTSRILKEIKDFEKCPVSHLAVFPSEGDITLWVVFMKGPDSTPYANGGFILQVRFSPNYPAQPPDVRFKTPIYHCNINSNGRICHQILSECYSPRFRMKEILGSIYALLVLPEASNPIDSVIGYNYQRAKMFVSDYLRFKTTEFWEAAEEHTNEHAIPRTAFDKVLKELSDGQYSWDDS